MKQKFIKYSLFFFTPIVLVFCVMELLTDHLPSKFKANQNYIEKQKNKFETLVLGSSQLMNGINAEWIESSTLNLASGSQHHDTDLKLLKTLRPKFDNLKTVVIELSYSHFELPHNGTKFWKNPLYLKYYHVNMFERKTYFKDKFIFLANPPFFLKNFYNYYIENDLYDKFNEFGFKTFNYSGVFKNLNYNEDEIYLIPQIDLNTVEDLSIFKKNTKLFFELLDYLEHEKINIIICKAPMYKTFLSKRNPSILKRRDSILQVVSLKYFGIKILDVEEDTLNFNVNDYINHSHLNPDGAKKFTLLLNEIINNIEN